MLRYGPNTKPPEVFGCVGLWPNSTITFGEMKHFLCFRPRTNGTFWSVKFGQFWFRESITQPICSEWNIYLHEWFQFMG